MLSPLARGYGSWTGDIDLCQSKSHTNDCFPTVGYPDPHRHGVTISPRGPVSTPSTAQTSHKTRFEPTDGKIPKTFLTRKGALLLFTAPDNGDKPESLGERTSQKNRKGKKLLDLSLKLGTIDRLCKSVLQYGDESYDRENSSITDSHNRFFLKFIRQTSELDDGGFDIHSQPGGELGFYLRDLKTRASSRIYSDGDPRSRTKSPELRELLRDLDGALPRTRRSVTLTDFTESQRGSPKQRVLSSKKLTASIKSSTYLGRPTSAGTKSSVSAANLPRIASQSSVKSRSKTSSKSGLWVQGYDETAKTEPRSTKPNSAASSARHSVHDTSISDSYIAMQDTEPALQTEEDATSAAEEQEIVLPSDAEEDDGFGAEEDNWPAVDEKEQNADEEQDTLSMTQPLQPQYNATGLMQDLEVPLEEDVDEDQLAEEQQEDDQKDVPVDEAGIQEVHVVTRVASPGGEVISRLASPSASPSEQPKTVEEADSLSYNQHTGTEAAVDNTEDVTKDNLKDMFDVDEDVDEKANTDEDVEEKDEDVTIADPDAVLAAADLEGFNEDQIEPAPQESGVDLIVDSHVSGGSGQTSTAALHPTAMENNSNESHKSPESKHIPENELSKVFKPDSISESDPTPCIEDSQVTKSLNKEEVPQQGEGQLENGKPDNQTGISPQEKDVNQIEGTMEEQDDTRSVEATEQEIPLAEGNIKDSTNTETSGITTPERDQSTATQNTDMATAEEIPAEHDTLKSTSTEPEELAPAESGNSPAAGAETAGQPGEASTEPPSTSAHPLISAAQPTQAVSTDTAVAPSPGPHSAEVLQSLSPVSGVKSVSPSPSVKARVTFDEKVTKQAAPKTPPHSVKQSVPPKAKPPVRPQTRILSKGSNNKKAGKQPNKSFVKAIEITSVQPEEEQKDETEAVTVAPPEKQARQKLPPARHVETLSDKTKSSVLPSHMEELLNRRSASKSQEELENEMAQMSEAVEITLAGPTLLVDTGEGLTEEELKLAQEALLERVKQAESQMEDVAKKEVKKPQAPVKVVQPKSRKKKNLPVEEKRNLQQEQAAIREQRKREKLQRLEEAKQLQEKIKAREAERKAKEKEAKKKAQQLAEEIQDLKREEDEIQQAEEDARYQLALARKVEREAREQRRRDDLERKKQEAIRRREKEKQMMEVARQKEEEMLKRIADNEMKRQLQEEEMRKREEEERLAQEQYEEELRQAQREAEEEELRLRELEKEAEEEAMQRLIEEREEAERRRWKLNELARQMEEEEERKRELMLEEERKLEAEKRKREEEEQQKLEEERKRLEELHRMEAEARENMRVELIRRREWALKRREANLERRENLDNTRHGQGITRAWVFSYFPDWPLESYNKPMGEDAKSKKGFRPQPKPKPKPKTDETEAPAPSGETTQKT